MREYERFEKGAANSNTSTRVLARQLADPGARIIITTIQKLARFVAAHKTHEIYHAHVVLIFDECHRSQFGDMHTQITKTFRGYHLFGFTGTPIFPDNAGGSGRPGLRTTEQAFGERLHTYTIVDAINDRNVLPFRIDYVNTIRAAAIDDKLVPAIDTERALLDPARLTQVVDYVLDHFEQKTKRSSTYRIGDRRVAGFNSLFATASIEAAKRYYNAFETAQRRREEADPGHRRIKIALIFSYAPNEDQPAGLLGEEEFETADLDQSSRDFLEDAIQDYNDQFGTSFDTSADRFENYYKDLARRLRDREVDLAIVVNMFLTGFDATTLNTLWVDKNLRAHGLLQAYSRTNRILNSVKTFGNIVCFRNLEEATNDALELFGNKDAGGIVLLAPYADYYADYRARVAELLSSFPLGEPIIGESAQKQFIAVFGAILRLRNILTCFDDFAGHEILTPREVQDHQSRYLDLYQQFRRRDDADKEVINDDVVFEIELIRQVEVNVDYILLLVRKHLEEHGTGADRELRATIDRAVGASPSLRNKKDLIDDFVDSVSVPADLDVAWRHYVEARREAELDQIIAEERLRPDETRSFVEGAFRDGVIPMSGTAITRILPPMSRFTAAGRHAAKKQAVLERLTAFLDRFLGLM